MRYTYYLTAKGRDLGDVLVAVARLGRKHIRGTCPSSEGKPQARLTRQDKRNKRRSLFPL